MKHSLRKSHSMIWKIMMVLIPAIIVVAVYLRQDPSRLAAPMQIAPPTDATQGGET